MAVTEGTGTDLSLVQCCDRLLASRYGFLSCTRFAMPLVVPVELAATTNRFC